MKVCTFCRILRRAVCVFTSKEKRDFHFIRSIWTDLDSTFRLKIESESVDYLRPKVFSEMNANKELLSKENAELERLETVFSNVWKRFERVSHCFPNASFESKEMIRFLLDCEIPDEALEVMVDRYPEILLLKVNELQTKIETFLNIGMQRSVVFEMLTTYPEILSFPFDSELKPILDFFAECFGSIEKAIHLISHVPVVLTYSLKNDISPHVEYLQNLGFHSEDLATLIETYPSILCLSIEKSIEAKIDYLLSRMPDLDIRFAILQFPGFLDMSLETHIKEKVEFFLDELEVDIARFSQFLPHFPQIFSCEIKENIKKKIEFLCVKMDVVEGKRRNLQILKRRNLAFLSCPSLFGFSQTRLLERIERIRHLVFLNEEILDDLFVHCTLIFGCTVDTEDLERVAASLLNSLDFDRIDFFKVLKCHPEILSLSPEEMEVLLISLEDKDASERVNFLSDAHKTKKRLESFASERLERFKTPQNGF